MRIYKLCKHAKNCSHKWHVCGLFKFLHFFPIVECGSTSCFAAYRLEKIIALANAHVGISELQLPFKFHESEWVWCNRIFKIKNLHNRDNLVTRLPRKLAYADRAAIAAVSSARGCPDPQKLPDAVSICLTKGERWVGRLVETHPHRKTYC